MRKRTIAIANGRNLALICSPSSCRPTDRSRQRSRPPPQILERTNVIERVGDIKRTRAAGLSTQISDAIVDLLFLAARRVEAVDVDFVASFSVIVEVVLDVRVIKNVRTPGPLSAGWITTTWIKKEW